MIEPGATMYTIYLRGRRLVYARRMDGPPRIDSDRETLRIGWPDVGGHWRQYRVQPREELVVERIGRRHYVMHILYRRGEDGDEVAYTSHTRPRPTRMRGSSWYRQRLTDTTGAWRYTVYLRSADGVVVIG